MTVMTSEALNNKYEGLLADARIYAQSAKATGAAAIDSTLAPGIAWQLETIKVHLSAAGAAGDLTATINNGTSAVYDVVLLTQDMTTVVDLVWKPDLPMEFAEDDELDIAWANGSSRTYGLEIIFKGI